MNLRALLNNRKAQIGAGLAAVVILLALMRRNSAGGDTAASTSALPAASTISEQGLGGDPNPAFAGPVTFADNGGYAAALGDSVVESLGTFSSALEGYQAGYDELNAQVAENQSAMASQLAAITSLLTAGGTSAGPAGGTPGSTPLPPAPSPVPSTPVVPPPAPANVAVGNFAGGPLPAQPNTTVINPPGGLVTGGFTGPTHTLTQPAPRPKGSDWSGSNVFLQDAGPNAGQWYRLVVKNGKRYRYYADGRVVPA